MGCYRFGDDDGFRGAWKVMGGLELAFFDELRVDRGGPAFAGRGFPVWLEQFGVPPSGGSVGAEWGSCVRFPRGRFSWNQAQCLPPGNESPGSSRKSTLKGAPSFPISGTGRARFSGLFGCRRGIYSPPPRPDGAWFFAKCPKRGIPTSSRFGVPPLGGSVGAECESERRFRLKAGLRTWGDSAREAR